MEFEKFLEEAKRRGHGNFIDGIVHPPNERPCAQRDVDFEGPQREFLVSPYIKVGDLTFLYAAKGVGKTCLALPVAYVIAEGSVLFGYLRSPKKHTGLYVDGEIGRSGFALRKESARRQLALPRGKKTSLWLLSGRFNLYSEADRNYLDEQILNINKASPADMPLSFIVLDNLTSMIGGKDGPEEWDAFFDWVTTLSNKGIAILIVYHANRDGMMRGSQSKTINAANMLYLEDPRLCGEDAPKPKRRKKKSQADNVPQDRSIIAIRIIPFNLRNNPYPEAYIPIEIEYSVIKSSWSMPKLELHKIEVLREQATYLSDEEMAPFWGVTARQIKEMRKKYGITKNHTSSSDEPLGERREDDKEEANLEDDYEDDEDYEEDYEEEND